MVPSISGGYSGVQALEENRLMYNNALQPTGSPRAALLPAAERGRSAAKADHRGLGVVAAVHP